MLLYCGIAWLVNLEETDGCLEAMPHKSLLRRLSSSFCSLFNSCYREAAPLRKRESYESV